MKKRVKVEVIDGDWEIKKYKIKKEIKEFNTNMKKVLNESGHYILIGVGIGLGIKMRSRV